MEISFKGKRALVTGAGQGIGRQIAVQLSKCGATVIGVDLVKDHLENLKKEIPSFEYHVVNLSDWKATEAVVKKAYPIDLLVNNAGIGMLEWLTDATEEKVDKIFNINTKAVINVSRVVVENLLSRKVPGSIVTISSQASKAGLLQHALYCATKGAVDGFTRAAALDYGPNNIRFNCVNPTVVMTELGKKVWSDPKLKDPMLAKIPLQRFAEIDDVVNAVVFLLSDKASMINGTCLAVDGGFLAC